MKFTRIFTVLVALTMILSCSKDDATNGQGNDPTTDDGPMGGTDDDPMSGNDFAGVIDQVNTYGGSNFEEAKNTVATPDGGIIVIGSTRSIDGDIVDKTSPNFDAWVLKLDAEGNIQWSKTYGGTNDDLGEDIILTADGGYAFIGSNRSNDGDTTSNAGSYDHWLVKLDAGGNVMWSKSYGFEGRDEAYSLIQTTDGGYFFGGVLDFAASGGQGNDGFTNSTEHAGGEYWGTKVTSDGTLEFRRYFGGSKDDVGRGVAQTADGGYFIAGSSESIDFNVSSPKGLYDYWIVKVGTDREIEWERSFGGSQLEFLYGFTTTRDGNYLLTGDARSMDGDVDDFRGVADFFTIKMSPNGDIIWDKTHGGSNFDAARTVFEMNDGSIAVAGSSRSDDMQVSSNRGQNDAYITILDNNGNLQHDFSVGGTGLDLLYGVTQNNLNEVFAVGGTDSDDFDITEQKGDGDVLLIKIK